MIFGVLRPCGLDHLQDEGSLLVRKIFNARLYDVIRQKKTVWKLQYSEWLKIRIADVLDKENMRQSA
jgi:hypothetical protein